MIKIKLMTMYRLLLLCIIICLLGIVSGCDRVKTDYAGDDLNIIARAYQNRESNLFVESRGIVEKLLSDDTEGTRHQRFIVRLANGQTVLLAHNIDIAPRIPDIQEGDEIVFRGEYEWNEEGGVIHWTHHDLLMKRQGGWIEHNGRRYQ